MDEGIKSPAAQELLEPLSDLYVQMQAMCIQLMTLSILSWFTTLFFVIYLISQVHGIARKVAVLADKAAATKTNHIKTD